MLTGGQQVVCWLAVLRPRLLRVETSAEDPTSRRQDLHPRVQAPNRRDHIRSAVVRRPRRPQAWLRQEPHKRDDNPVIRRACPRTKWRSGKGGRGGSMETDLSWRRRRCHSSSPWFHACRFCTGHSASTHRFSESRLQRTARSEWAGAFRRRGASATASARRPSAISTLA